MIDICEQVAESLSAFLDSEVAGTSVGGLDRASIDAHLRVCTYCGALRPGARSGAVPPPPPRVWDNIESTLREEGLIRD